MNYFSNRKVNFHWFFAFFHCIYRIDWIDYWKSNYWIVLCLIVIELIIITFLKWKINYWTIIELLMIIFDYYSLFFIELVIFKLISTIQSMILLMIFELIIVIELVIIELYYDWL